MTINQRVLKLIEQLSTNKAEFAKRTGISAVKISHIASGRNKVSLDTVQQILKAYPSVNAEYIINEKGLMFKDTEDQQLRESLNQLQRLEQHLKLAHKQQMDIIQSVKHHILAQRKPN